MTTTTERAIPPSDSYRCICGITLPVQRHMTRLDCSCGRSFDADTIGDPPHGAMMCACGSVTIGERGTPCLVCGAARRPMVDPLGDEGQAHADEPAPAAPTLRTILPSSAYACPCGAHIRVIARTDRATCEGCGRTYLGADAIGDPAYGRWTCRCGSTSDDAPEGRPGAPCRSCGAARRRAVDPWPDGIDPDSVPYAAFTGDLLTEAAPGVCALPECRAEAVDEHDGYCSAGHWVAGFKTRRATRRGGIIEQTNEHEGD